MAVALKKNMFLPDPEVEDIPKTLEVALKEVRKGKPSSGVAKYGYVTKDGNFKLDTNTYCHAGLSESSPANTDYVVGYLNKKFGELTPEPEKVRRAFTEWLVNFSPFRSVFVTHDIDAIMKDEFVITSVDHPYNLMAGALMAMRAMCEHPATSVIWYELVANGCHPNLAFYIAYSFKTDGKQLYPGHSSHTGCYETTCVNRETLVNILTENFTGLVKETYRTRRHYRSAQSLFTGGGENTQIKLVKQINKKLNGLKSVINPFAKPAVGDRWSFKEGCEALAEAIKEEFKPELEKLNGKA